MGLCSPKDLLKSYSPAEPTLPLSGNGAPADGIGHGELLFREGALLIQHGVYKKRSNADTDTWAEYHETVMCSQAKEYHGLLSNWETKRKTWKDSLLQVSERALLCRRLILNFQASKTVSDYISVVRRQFVGFLFCFVCLFLRQP